MGEEKKEEEKKVEEKKEEEKKEDEPQEIVLKVDMHCEACARRVAKSLKGFQGVEDVITDCKASKVVVKGKTADPIKVCERIQRKTGRNVEIISPLPKPPEENQEEKKEETKEEKKEEVDPTSVMIMHVNYILLLLLLNLHWHESNKTYCMGTFNKEEEEPPTPITVLLNVRMHCDACAHLIQKRIRKIQGVESVTTDLPNGQVIVKGIVDPTKLVEDIYKKTRKQASIVPPKEEEKKEEEKKEEEKKEEEKKEGGEEGKEEDEIKSEIKRREYWPARYYIESQYAYPPQIFSDENPNACSVM